MSGPKTSSYTLTPEQRRILEEQRRILEEQRITEQRKVHASQSIQRNSKELLQMGALFSSEKQISAELYQRTGSDGGFSQKYNELEMLVASVAGMVAKTDNNNVHSLEKTAAAIENCVKKAEKMVRELSKIAAQNERKLRADLDTAIDAGLSAMEDEDIVVETPDGDVKDKIQAQLLQMKENALLPTEWKEEIDKALSKTDEMQDEGFLKNYFALTVSPLLKRCESFLTGYEEWRGEFEKLSSEYTALCEMYYYVAQDYPCSPASVDVLKAEIQRIKEKAAEEDEQAYISECLDEVMEEMGYAVLGSREVTKKNGRHFRNELYTYGDGTAVNVTYSSDGRIAMELGGVDTADRLPDERETSLLCDSMERFCDDFKEIEERLLVKGVVLKERLSLLPPSPEYAQIINVSDYETKREAETIQAQKQRKTMSKLKTREQCEKKF